ncbi:RING finger protein 227 [Hippoglossus hippoglossus]|uniref:RING finger protein 227 n=1 Tax=Hippoglossus hippoglossus TaxID=8267 RepID=UPI00148D34F9|nr:RING finger protein 227 [Hippoglossus hippoglossus]XP_035004350.1 E3 ubiquitin-protein ligase-like [Hippoglossus stenolepis]
MYSHIECGICYRTYNAGRRCPRELRCRHTFCEGCLLALSRPGEGSPGADTAILCPLCRQTTSIPCEGRIRSELRVDESVLARLMEAEVLDQEEEEDPEEAPDQDEDEGATLQETQAEESDSSAGSRGGKVRRSLKKVWKVISGKSLQQGGGQNCMTSDDLRNLAMMSCYMF